MYEKNFQDCINLYINSYESMQNIPRVFRVGDIVRVHRANITNYNGKINLNVGINTKGLGGSYVIFNGSPDYDYAYINQQNLPS